MSLIWLHGFCVWDAQLRILFYLYLSRLWILLSAPVSLRLWLSTPRFLWLLLQLPSSGIVSVSCPPSLLLILKDWVLFDSDSDCGLSVCGAVLVWQGGGWYGHRSHNTTPQRYQDNQAWQIYNSMTRQARQNGSPVRIVKGRSRVLPIIAAGCRKRELSDSWSTKLINTGHIDEWCPWLGACKGAPFSLEYPYSISRMRLNLE